MSTPFFSVIVVCRNAGDKLYTTVQSILSQAENDYEILIKDAMSDDGSIERLPENERIRVIREKDHGIYDGMNAAVQAARGEILYFLNCGDVLHDSGVLRTVRERILAAREAGHAADRGEDGAEAERQQAAAACELANDAAVRLYYGDVIERTSGQHVMANPVMSHFAMFRYLPCHQACFYDRAAFAARGFDTRYQVRADYEHFLWCVIRGGVTPVYLDIIIADYEGGGFSETTRGRALSKAEHRSITEAYFTSAELLRFRAYLVLTLQPLREKIAQNKVTAGLYDAVKNLVYGIKARSS